MSKIELLLLNNFVAIKPFDHFIFGELAVCTTLNNIGNSGFPANIHRIFEVPPVLNQETSGSHLKRFVYFHRKKHVLGSGSKACLQGKPHLHAETDNHRDKMQSAKRIRPYQCHSTGGDCPCRRRKVG